MKSHIHVPQSAGLDEEWYRQLKPLLTRAGETFIALEPPAGVLRRARREFVSSSFTALPELYPHITNRDELRTLREELGGLGQQVYREERTIEIRELYTERINELIANIDMILAAASGNEESYQRANEFVYGLPNRDISAAVCSWIREDVFRAREFSIVVPELCDDILRLVPEAYAGSSLVPTDAVFQKVKALHFIDGGYIDQLFSGVTFPDEPLTPANSDAMTRQIIQNIGSDFDLVDSLSGLWAVIQSKGQVERPAYFELNKRSYMAIVSHEVGSHLLESTNGAASQLKLLELGLDRYEAGNEGRAFLREQIQFDTFDDYVNQPGWFPTKASWEYRVAIHLAISLATGLYGERYDFAQVYQVLIALFMFWTAKRGENIDDKVIADGAWSMAVRALKGTDGHGGAYHKDIVYLEGNVRCWRAAERRPEMILYGDKGKFDIGNRAHVTALTKLGILQASTT